MKVIPFPEPNMTIGRGGTPAPKTVGIKGSLPSPIPATLDETRGVTSVKSVKGISDVYANTRGIKVLQFFRTQEDSQKSSAQGCRHTGSQMFVYVAQSQYCVLINVSHYSSYS